MDWSSRIGRRLKLRDLHILLTVANCASMTKAARELAVSNPVISKAIAELEHVAGVRLVERGPRGVELTVYGHALARHGLTVFDELRQAVQHIEFLSDPTVGELRIGSTVMLASGLVASVVEALTRRSPRMKFQLIGGETGIVLRALENRQIDLVVTRLHDITLKDDFQTEVLYEEADVVVAGRTNPLARRRSLGLHDLANEPWVLPPYDSLYGGVVAEAFRKARMDLPSPTMETLTGPARLAFAATGRFLTMVPRSALRGVTKSLPLVILPIDLQTKRRPVAVVMLRGRTPNPIAPLFVSEARKLVGRLNT